MKILIYIKRDIKTLEDLPKDCVIHVGNKKGYEELVYIENGETKKPWRYDDEDTTTIKIWNIAWYLQEIELELPDDEEMNKEANNYGCLVKENITPDYGVEENASLDFLRGSNWLRSKIIEQLNIKK